jgi:hypothetical protein
MNSMPGSAIQLVPKAVQGSPLMKKGGFDVFEGLPDRKTCARLLAEARHCLATAKPSDVSVSDNEEVRGGRPARRFLSAIGGAVQEGLYQDRGVIHFLETICNVPILPTGGRGTYTYYARSGDHLALHRDIETCDVALITCLLDRHNPGSSGGVTRLYPQRQTEPLSRIRATPGFGSINVRVLAGQTMVMFGGVVPHAIVPLEAGEMRVVSVLCYHAYSMVFSPP